MLPETSILDAADWININTANDIDLHVSVLHNVVDTATEPHALQRHADMNAWICFYVFGDILWTQNKTHINI